MTTSEIIQPSFILPSASEQFPLILSYSPVRECFFYSIDREVLGILDIATKSTVKNVAVNSFTRAAALSSDGCMLALNVQFEFLGRSNPPRPTQICIVHVGEDSVPPSFYIKPDFGDKGIQNLRFFPDGSKIIATHSNSKEGPWAKIFTFPKELREEDETTGEDLTSDRNNKTLLCEDIDVFKQGFPIPDDRSERIADAETAEEYFTLYNQMYYASNIDGGFYCLAISPDTTRLLAGSNDGEVYIIESSSQKVLQCVRTYEYYKTVSGCHYSPVFGHQEFVTCVESGFLDIWHVQELDDGKEEASSVHRLKFEPGTSCCTYSPDGKLIALTSSAVFKTYIICSHSGDTLFNLVYKEEQIDQSYCLNTNLFFGYLCQVATIQYDNSICFWQLPLVYSLKTLCLLFIRASVNYNNIDSLPLSPPMKLQLKYLYV